MLGESRLLQTHTQLTFGFLAISQVSLLFCCRVMDFKKRNSLYNTADSSLHSWHIHTVIVVCILFTLLLV